MSMPIEVIVNAGSGSVEREEETKRLLEELFEENGVEAVVHLAASGKQIIDLARRAAEKSDAQIIVAGGGDGTVSAVASELVNTDKTLGVLPLGTLNNFSKDLRIPQELAQAVQVIAENYMKEIDVGEVNGRIFVNNSSIGLYPSIVRRRVRQQKMGYGKWRAAFWAALKVLRIHPFLRIKLKLEDKEFLRKTPFVFVGNNEYEMDFFNIGRRAAMDDGKLSVYFLHRAGRAGLVLLILRAIFGRLRQTKDFEAVSTEEITISTRKKRLLVAFDGEIAVLQTPLQYRILPKALRVIVPKESEE